MDGATGRALMPWRIRRLIYFVILGCAAITLSMIVAVRDTNLDTELLSFLGLAGGLAIILNALPANGHDKS
jgi:hypothetical protein